MQKNEKKIIYGCMGLGGGWDSNPVTGEDERRAYDAIHTALSVGIDTFDLADIYRLGKAETVFGRVLRQSPGLREKIRIQSKAGIRIGKGPNGSNIYDSSKKYIIESVQKILKRLEIEYLDLFMIHRYDILTSAEEIADTFTHLKNEGLVKKCGVSNMSVAQLENIRHYQGEPAAVNQLQLSLGHHHLVNTAIYTDMLAPSNSANMAGMLEYCERNGIILQAWGATDHGSYTEYRNDGADEKTMQTTRLVHALAEKYGISTSAIVLAWLFRISPIIQPVIGSTAPERIKASAQATGIELEREDWYTLWITAKGENLP